tara:strand:+ start:418 stop:753 length:336 start_codon:yes stop_codon:yes gene_type:complete
MSDTICSKVQCTPNVVVEEDQTCPPSPHPTHDINIPVEHNVSVEDMKKEHESAEREGDELEVWDNVHKQGSDVAKRTDVFVRAPQSAQVVMVLGIVGKSSVAALFLCGMMN